MNDVSCMFNFSRGWRNFILS